jgi:hypothetical protein
MDSVKRTFTLIVAILSITGIAFLTNFIYTFQQKGYRINTTGTAVVKEIQKLQRLETASYTIEKIIDAGTQGTRFQQFLYGDKILLIANGQVIAGFDLSTVTENDVTIQEDRITVNLPAPQVLFTRLDNDKTRVYDRSTGILSKGERDLESEARAQAEIEIRTAACESDILATAEENGRKQMTALFTALGFREVTVNIPKGNCR